MKVNLWGTRGSLASPGPDTVRYGGNTSCVTVTGSQGSVLVLDAGTGIRLFGQHVGEDLKCVHILLTHLHMDHVQGLPFFEPLRRPGFEVHIWGPASTTMNLEERLLRYLSPPLFPVRVRDLLSNVSFHELSYDTVEIGEFRVTANQVIHPNPTIGYRVEGLRNTLAYLPDHEPALGDSHFPSKKEWTSGFDLVDGVDLLIHDAQYSAAEYPTRLGFGHSSIQQAFQIATLAGVIQLIPFHHDPAHSDDDLDKMILEAVAELQPTFEVTPAMEGTELIF